MPGGGVDVVGNVVVLVANGERPGRFDEQHDRAVRGRGPVKGAPGHHEDLVPAQDDGPLPVVFTKADVDGPVEHEKELVGVGVHVPDVLPGEAGEPDVVVVEVGDDARTPGVGERGEDVVEGDGLAHGVILPRCAGTARVLG